MRTRVSLKLFLILIVAPAVIANPKSPEFTKIGSYSNFRFTEEHQYGAQIQLWKEGSSFLGYFLYSEGLVGDTPTGLLESAKYNPGSGSFSFKAKLTTGQHYCQIHKDIPSRDLFSFKGKLSASSITGVLRRSDALHPKESPTEQKVVLAKINAQSAGLFHYKNRSEWKAASKEILELRGPRW